MALSAEEIKRLYPLPAYNYKVSFDGTNISFSQVSGLAMTFETSTYKESPIEDIRGPVTMRMPGQHADVTLTLQKGIVRGQSVSSLFTWINSIKTNIVQKKDVRIELLDEEGVAVIRWTVRNAFPTSLEAPTFDASTNDVAIESLQLMADSILIEDES